MTWEKKLKEALLTYEDETDKKVNWLQPMVLPVEVPKFGKCVDYIELRLIREIPD